MPLSNIVHEINESLNGKLFHLKRFSPAGIYGVSGQATMDKATFPVVWIDATREYKYVGIEDLNTVILYHKLNQSSLVPDSRGYGDRLKKNKVTHSMTMIIFLNTFNTQMKADELFLYIQAAMPDTVNIENFDYISISINSVILNSKAVFGGEYQGVQYFPKAEHSLMAINYTIESEYKVACFNSCPEV